MSPPGEHDKGGDNTSVVMIVKLRHELAGDLGYSLLGGAILSKSAPTAEQIQMVEGFLERHRIRSTEDSVQGRRRESEQELTQSRGPGESELT